ncbi:RNA polymerase sigma factor [Pedosphaera parvula]|uniref:RNA polymerase, sigma-24 subunit, ECF subfamily n=1 Tax=Pedosphaera parvula (strain Ellin514) TaxID=320771 RepID=B9XJL6_PEDPL|nr:sigma-70 family RNA polymerase sigma factor [Pedosphaera parvula]EEF59892.1 RNA polymerase, sigma-24 subunit, ECF subfamily [Pedosphaera parvula Ellin514]
MPETGFDMPACLERVRRRDEEAARMLFQELYPLVIKLVRSHLPRRTGEEDLVQMVFMKIFTHLDQYAGKVPFQHWVSRIAVNTCIKVLRAEKVRPEVRWADLGEDEGHVLDLLASTQEELNPDQSLASRELAEKLMALLNPEDRLVMNLLTMEGRSIEEVKQITGWNESVIKVRAFRARNKLRKHFKQLMREERR